MHPDADDELLTIWEQVRAELEASVPATTFSIWLDPLRPRLRSGSTLRVTAPASIRAWVERRYADRLLAAVRRAMPEIDTLDIVGDSEASAEREAAQATLDPGQTFASFVIGSGNRLAHGAALAVAELPGDAYNPLFLHGTPGLGKTHLLSAIAAYVRDHHPGLTVIYTTAERFTTEFVAALRHSGPERFKQRYRGLDALLIDDVQVLEGKERTQEEFVHTFNALHSAGKQIVLSSDRPPDALSRLEERLRDRFRWGLCIGLDDPDLQTRMILLWRLACAQTDSPPPPAALREMAERTPGNVRSLEGAATRVLALASILREPISEQLIRDALAGDPHRLHPPDVESIQNAVCTACGITKADLLSARRASRISHARQLAMYLARELTDLSLAQIARSFDRDHTTVLHSVRTVSRRLEPGSETEKLVHRIRKDLRVATPTVTAPTTL